MTTATMPEIQAGPWDVSREEYHADRTCLSNSALRDFRRSVPLFHGRYIDGSIPGQEPSEEMKLGTAIHALILEPHRYSEQVAVFPEGIDRRTKAGKAEWQAFCESSAGKTVITAEQQNTAWAMSKTIMADSNSRNAIMSAGKVEYAIRWQDQKSGLWIRNLIDKLMPENGLIVDLKTASDPTPSGFGKSIANYDYHCQAALYSAGVRAVFGTEPEFLFIVVGSQPPHEVCCYLLDSVAAEIGEKKNRAALDEIADRKITGDWRSRFADQIQTASLPKWAIYQESQP